MKFLLFGVLTVLIGCSSIQKVATRSTTPIFKNASQKLMRESSWEFFKDSNPGNLKFMEMIYFSDTNNTELLGILVKGYAGYAFGVLETLHFQEELSGEETTKWKQEAITIYTKALDYGLEYLQTKNVTRADLLNFDDQELAQRLNKNLSEEDYIPLLYLAQVWGSLINLQKDNVALVAQVPKVKTLFDWVCSKDQNIENGVCDMFYAQYEASRPKMLGGDPVKAEELYKNAFEKYPKNLLLRVSYIQYMALPGFDEGKYEDQASFLRKEFPKFEDQRRDSLENKSEYLLHEDLNLFNAIAKKRFEIIEQNKIKIF